MAFTAPTLTMDTIIEGATRLGKIEAEENVTILFAIESGSRAWGFPSPDSDFDVRFVYTRPLSAYVGLDDPEDTIERPIDGLWDLAGWDIGKALKLLVKGNATITEWLNSPLIYREHGPMAPRLRGLVKRYATPAASARHYFGLTQKSFRESISNVPTAAQVADAEARGVQIKGMTTVPQKKYLYALRGALSIAWIAAYNEVPPMTLPALKSVDLMPEPVRAELDALLVRKANMGEFGYGPRIAILDDFVEEKLAWAKAQGFDKLEIDPAFKAEANQLLLDALGVG